MPTPQEARSRQTAYLATEHWWRSRVEAIAEFWRREARKEEREDFATSETLDSCARALEALIAERNPQ